MSRYAITGRLVQGDPHKGQPQTDKNRQPKLKKDGTQLIQWFVAVAVPKNPADRLVVPGVTFSVYEDEKARLDADARAAWPQFFGGQRHPTKNYAPSLPLDCTLPDFANKIVDGDDPDYAGYEGWTGCWIVKCSNGFAPTISEWMVDWRDPRGTVKTDWIDTMLTGRVVKSGDYVTVSGDCVSNNSSDSPGMYMNFDTVGFEQEGPYIAPRTSVDTKTALGTRGGAAPNAQPAAVASQPAPAVGGQTSQTASPYSGYRETAPPPPGNAAPPPPSGPQLTAKAQYTYEKYVKSGWSDAQLRSAGILA